MKHATKYKGYLINPRMGWFDIFKGDLIDWSQHIGSVTTKTEAQKMIEARLIDARFMEHD